MLIHLSQNAYQETKEEENQYVFDQHKNGKGKVKEQGIREIKENRTEIDRKNKKKK